MESTVLLRSSSKAIQSYSNALLSWIYTNEQPRKCTCWDDEKEFYIENKKSCSKSLFDVECSKRVN